MLGLLVFALIAIGCAAYIIASNALPAYVTAGALLVLAVGQIIFILMSSWRLSRFEDRLVRQRETMKSLTGAHDEIGERLDEMENRLARQPPVRLDEISAEIRSLRDSIRGLAYPAEPKPAAPVYAPPPEAPRAATVEPRPEASAERLDLMLEPVIELSTGTTTHYRAQLDLTDEQGHLILHHDLMSKADRGGMRAALDVHLLKQVTPVLRRLRVKQPNLRIFVPLGAATLAGRADMARLTDILDQDGDVAAGIVFEITQETLGNLGTSGIESLAELGRLGATMGLSNVMAAGLDLGSLRQLGVRFLSIGAASIDSGFGLSSAWREFTQYARALQFQIIASGISAAPQATAATQIARFGCGPFFAPPRKVRNDAGAAAGQHRTQAA